MDSALYTKPYTATQFGAIFLPGHVAWRVLPRYVGRREDGSSVVDDRITLVLQDEPNRFWPVIVKMSVEEAERLRHDLEQMIEQKRGAAGGPPAAGHSG